MLAGEGSPAGRALDKVAFRERPTGAGLHVAFEVDGTVYVCELDCRNESHGRWAAVRIDPPELWVSRRRATSDVRPT